MGVEPTFRMRSLSLLVLLSLDVNTTLGPIHTKWKRERKRKRSENKQKKSKHKWQTSMKIFTLVSALWMGLKLCFTIFRTCPPKIMPNILHNIGNTPLVRINNITKNAGIKAEIRECPVVVKTRKDVFTVSESDNYRPQTKFGAR